MTITAKHMAIAALVILFVGNNEAATEPGSKVTVLRTPNGGIQPQAVADAKGALHLIYYKGEAGAGEIFYVRREAGQERFSEPLRVNSQPGSAIAAGTVRGGQLALGKAGRVHVAWNGSGKSVGMLYARLNDARTAFEDQRDLMQQTDVLDGGGTVAADDVGNVYVAWHGNVKGKPNETEGTRKVWIVRSTDEGKSFSKEAPANTQPTGACACCSTKAFVDSKGNLNLLYRSATAKVNRDIYLLSSKDKGTSFQSAIVHKWKVPG
jgi:hypothetical protein